MPVLERVEKSRNPLSLFLSSIPHRRETVREQLRREKLSKLSFFRILFSILTLFYGISAISCENLVLSFVSKTYGLENYVREILYQRERVWRTRVEPA